MPSLDNNEPDMLAHSAWKPFSCPDLSSSFYCIFCSSIAFIYKISSPFRVCLSARGPNILIPSALIAQETNLFIRAPLWDSCSPVIHFSVQCKNRNLIFPVQIGGNMANFQDVFYAILMTCNVMLFEATAASGPTCTEAFPHYTSPLHFLHSFLTVLWQPPQTDFHHYCMEQFKAVYSWS